MKLRKRRLSSSRTKPLEKEPSWRDGHGKRRPGGLCKMCLPSRHREQITLCKLIVYTPGRENSWSIDRQINAEFISPSSIRKSRQSLAKSFLLNHSKNIQKHGFNIFYSYSSRSSSAKAPERCSEFRSSSTKTFFEDSLRWCSQDKIFLVCWSYFFMVSRTFRQRNS